MKTKQEDFNLENELLKLLKKRFNSLNRYSKKEQKDGYVGLPNLRIENNTILFDDNIEDCRFDNKYFYVVGDEGEEKISLNDDIDIILKNIKKSARKINSKGLK